MSLFDYDVCGEDHFEYDAEQGLDGFPCCVCVHRLKFIKEEPCASCGHNDFATKRERMGEMDRFDQDENHGCDDEEPQWRCTICGRIGSVGRCCGLETREPLNEPARKEYLESMPLARAEKAEAEVARWKRLCRERGHYWRSRAEKAEAEVERLKEMDYLHEGDTIAHTAKYLSEHPELDMVESKGETPDGEKFTICVLRGHQDIVGPLRNAKAEVERLRKLCAERPNLNDDAILEWVWRIDDEGREEG